MIKNRRNLLKLSIFKRPDYQNFALAFGSLPIAFMMLVTASIAVAVFSADAWSYWECSSTSSSAAYQRHIGYETYNTGTGKKKLVVSCVNNDNEKTYVEGDGSIVMDFSIPNPRTVLLWSVELDGNTPKRYVKGACTTAGRESQMCFKEQGGTDAEAYGALDTTQVYWRLNTIAKDADGDGRSSASPIALTGVVGDEIPDDSSNENKFIRAAANSDNNGPLLDALANTNGLENFELVIDGVTVRSTGASVGSTGADWEEQVAYTTHIETGGEPDQIKSYTVRVTNGAKVSGGRRNADTHAFGSGGIFVGDGGNSDRQTTRWAGPVTVDISGGSTVESWASTDFGKYPRAVRIDLYNSNPNLATLKLTGGSKLGILHPSAPQSWTDEAGKLKTNGSNSPGIQVSYLDGYGSVRVNTPLAIETYGDDSPGISASFASKSDSLRVSTREADILENGVSWGLIVWWTYATGDTNAERLFGPDYSEGDEISATEGLTRADIARVFNGGTPPSAARGPFAGCEDCLNGPLSRMEVQRPDLYAKRTQIARIVLNTMTDAQFLEYKRAFLRGGKNSPAAFLRHRDGSAGAGIVYEIDKKSMITTYGENAAGIVAEAAVPEFSRTTIRIDDGDDFGTDLAAAPDADKVEIDHDDDADTPAITVFKTKIVVDEPITTVGERSHGIWVMGMNGPSPLDEQGGSYRTRTKRDIEITANANISATGKDAYAIVLLGDEGTNSKINLGESATLTGGIYLGKGTNSISGAGTLSGPIMGVAGGTLAELDLSGNTGDDNIILDSSLTVTGNVSLGGGDDTVTVRGAVGGELSLGDGDNTVVLEGGSLSSVSGVKILRKTTERMATVGDISFSGSVLRIEAGELRVSGHVDLGATGTATVDDGAVLTFVVPREVTTEEMGGRITAQSIVFASISPDVRMRYDDSGDVSDEDAEAARSRLVTAGTRVLYQDSSGVSHQQTVRVEHTDGGKTVEIATQSPAVPPSPAQPQDPGTQPQDPGTQPQDPGTQPQDPGTQPQDPGTQPQDPGTQPPGPSPQPSAADDDDNTGLYAAGAIAVLWWLMCETGADGSMSDGGSKFCFGKSQWNSTGAVQYAGTGTNSWASLQSDKGINPVQGLSFGTNVHVGENARIGFSAMPNASRTTGSLGASLNKSSSISGGLYSLQGEWGRDSSYASVALTHANLTAGTRFENIVSGGGMLGGEFEMRQSHLQLTAGTKLDAGGVSWTPSLGLYGGSVDHDGYSASNAVLLAKVPGYRQSYRGWKLGLRAESKERMSSSGGLKWHPGVSVDMYRTVTSGPRSLTLSQTDRTGALSLSDRMPVGGLPNRIVALRAGGTIEIPHAGEFRMDYVGMEMDGEIQHGALLKYQNRF